MLIPEEHAKNTICPILTMNTKEKTFCQGTGCMMWAFSNYSSKTERGFCGLVAGYSSLMQEDKDFKMYE